VYQQRVNAPAEYERVTGVTFDLRRSERRAAVQIGGVQCLGYHGTIEPAIAGYDQEPKPGHLWLVEIYTQTRQTRRAQIILPPASLIPQGFQRLQFNELNRF
jgi:hypothetical protein